MSNTAKSKVKIVNNGPMDKPEVSAKQLNVGDWFTGTVQFTPNAFCTGLFVVMRYYDSTATTVLFIDPEGEHIARGVRYLRSDIIKDFKAVDVTVTVHPKD